MVTNNYHDSHLKFCVCSHFFRIFFTGFMILPRLESLRMRNKSRVGKRVFIEESRVYPVAISSLISCFASDPSAPKTRTVS